MFHTFPYFKISSAPAARCPIFVSRIVQVRDTLQLWSLCTVYNTIQYNTPWTEEDSTYDTYDIVHPTQPFREPVFGWPS